MIYIQIERYRHLDRKIQTSRQKDIDIQIERYRHLDRKIQTARQKDTCRYLDRKIQKSRQNDKDINLEREIDRIKIGREMKEGFFKRREHLRILSKILNQHQKNNIRKTRNTNKDKVINDPEYLGVQIGHFSALKFIASIFLFQTGN